MKKVYLAPQTEAIQLLSENAMMAGSPYVNTYVNPVEGTKGGPSTNY